MTFDVDPNSTIPVGYPKDTNREELEAIETRLAAFDPTEFYDPITGELSHEGEHLVGIGLTILSQAVYTLVESKGFHDKGRSFGEEVALMHSELSESLEEWRDGKSNTYYKHPGLGLGVEYSVGPYGGPNPTLVGKGEGVVTELADAVIRECDSAEGLTRGKPVEGNFSLALALIYKLRYNATRPHMHGKSA